MPIALAPFDPSRDFTAQTSFRAGGRIWLRKKPFDPDKRYVNDRVRRQLYEARKIAYTTDEELAAVKTVRLERAGEVALDDQTGPLEFEDVSGEQQDTEEASGTAREAPGDEESTSTPSGEASVSATEEGAAAVPDVAPSTETAGGEANLRAPSEAEGAGATGGESATPAPDRETRIKRLVKRYNHEELFAKASGLKGVTKVQTKTEIATALVDAGRVGDGPA